VKARAWPFLDGRRAQGERIVNRRRVLFGLGKARIPAVHMLAATKVPTRDGRAALPLDVKARIRAAGPKGMETRMAKKSQDATHDVSGVAGAQLKAYIERIERLTEEVKGLQDDIKDVYGEAKANGFDVKIMRKIIAMRKRDVEERQEEEAILELYMQALGMIPGAQPTLQAAE
jgi:uncharacterized protein (UPF0335 family)